MNFITNERARASNSRLVTHFFSHLSNSKSEFIIRCFIRSQVRLGFFMPVELLEIRIVGYQTVQAVG